jgi:hypothetical protein
MIKLRILLVRRTSCQGKMFFMPKEKKKERERETKTTKLHIEAKMFSFYPSTAKAAARGYEIREEKEEGFSLLLGTGNIKASRETEKLSALRQNVISSQSFSLSLSAEQRQKRTRLHLQSHIQH